MKALLTALALCALLAFAGCGGDSSDGETTAAAAPAETGAGAEAQAGEGAEGGDASERGKPEVKVPAGAPPAELVKRDIVEGTGPAAKPGDRVTVEYVGVGFDSKEQFDASWDRGEPFSFSLDGGEVIPGWDQGIAGMKVGGRRELVIPPELAYGSGGYPPSIAPEETLIFVVDLLATE